MVKGIVLTGGSDTRLIPFAKVTSRQLIRRRHREEVAIHYQGSDW